MHVKDVEVKKCGQKEYNAKTNCLCPYKAYYSHIFLTQCQFGIPWIANILPLVHTVHL